MNKTTIFGIIIALGVGVGVGYVSGSNSVKSMNNAKIAEFSTMIIEDGKQMQKMGDIMIKASTLLEERGTTYNDSDLIMMAGDLSAYGTKSLKNGKSMTDGNMATMEM